MNKNLIYTIVAGAILLFNVALAFFIPSRPDFHCGFLIVLLTTFVLAIIFRHRFTKREIAVARTLLGCMFIFSGFVKGVDPLGSDYKFTDYFNAFGMEWMNFSALFFSFVLSLAEFMIGVCLFLNIKTKWAAWGALFFMAFFTPLTLVLAIKNPVTDCGCFGDALILSNWETFWKNVVLLAMALVIFYNKKKFCSMFNFLEQTVIILCTIAFMTSRCLIQRV